MMAMFFLQTTPAPQSMVALLWIIVTVLAGVVLLLFRQLRKSEEEKSVSQMEMLEKVLTISSEANTAINGLADAIETIQQQFSIVRELDKLRQDIRDDIKKD